MSLSLPFDQKLYEKHRILGRSPFIARPIDISIEGIMLVEGGIKLREYVQVDRDDTLVDSSTDLAIKKKILGGVVKGVKYIHDSMFIHGDLDDKKILIVEGAQNLTWPKICGLEKAIYCGMEQSLQRSCNAVGGAQNGLFEEGVKNDLVAIGRIVCYFLVRKKIKFDPISQKYPNLKELDEFPEAKDLLKCIEERTLSSASEVLNHPFFWKKLKKTNFLEDVSELLDFYRLPNQPPPKQPPPKVAKTKSIVDKEKLALFSYTLINEKLEKFNDWQQRIGDFRTEFEPNVFAKDPVGLLRAIRNKSTHRHELSADFIGAILPEKGNLANYVCAKLPTFLIELHSLLRETLKENPFFVAYY